MKTSYLLFLIFVLFLSLPVTGQKAPKKITLSGIVTDSNQKPVSGALILIDNQKTNTITDEKGAYKIRVSAKAMILSVFSVNSGAKETPIDGRTEINFTLNSSQSASGTALNDPSDNETLDVGYGTMKKKDISTSVAKIDGTNIKYSSYQNIYDLIRGEIPGVQVSGNRIIIQGISSFNLTSDPLLVVDGSVVNSIDDISPRIVKSVGVLKGPAASIYGSRGSNGVILIYLLGAPEKQN